MIELLGALAQASIRALVVAALVGLMLTAARAKSSSLRHAAWVGVLCAMLAMPVLPLLVPPVQAPVSVPSIPREMIEPRWDPPPAVDAPSLPPPEATMPAAPPLRRSISIPEVIFAAYLLGVLALAGRLALGWVAIRRVVSSSVRVSHAGALLYETPAIATPVTAGIIRPKVLLPADWREWSDAKLRAVVAHELAHIERRDPLTSLLARINCCVFWFHPLAWWLQRTIALAAECACDDAAVRTVGEGRAYAGMLVELAETIRRSGRRLSLPAPGVDSGMIGFRIERILRGSPVAAVRKSRLILTVAACAGVVLVVAACRDNSVRPLKPDPSFAEERANIQRYAEERSAVERMTPQQAAELESRVSRHPDDVTSRQALMRYYQTKGRQVLGDQEAAERLLAHKVWFVRNHPADPYALLASPRSDPARLEEERKLWLALAARPDTPPMALANAAVFFKDRDPQRAEQIYHRVTAADPKRLGVSWLGSLYAGALFSANASPEYKAEVRRRLDASSDARLLEATGWWLLRQGDYRNSTSASTALGKSYLERSLQLKPDSRLAHMALAMSPVSSRNTLLRPLLRIPSLDGQAKAAAEMPEADRFPVLADLAENAYWRGESLDYYKHDSTSAKAAWEMARRDARESLRIASSHRDDARYGTAVYRANITLGTVAMRADGDKRAAVKYLLAASHAPATDELRYMVDGLAFKLPVALLRYGGATERAAVIEYLERYGRIANTANNPSMDLIHSAQQLRQGYMPLWYEVQAAKLK